MVYRMLTNKQDLTQECVNSQFSARPEGALLQSEATKRTLNSQLKYNGIPYTDIIQKYWELFNDGKQPVEGDRNVKTFELAVNLRNICDFSKDRMLQIIPNYFGQAGTDEWCSTIDSALKEPHKGMPYRMKQVLTALKETGGIKACGGTVTTPPPMPGKLPPLIKLLTRNVPQFYKPAVASAVFPALAAHLHGV